MIKRAISPALVLVFAAVLPAFAQQSAKACRDREAVGFLGISGIECNCTIGNSDPDKWSFRTEPRITSLELDTRGGRVLKIGDAITHIDGKLITTRDGARAMAMIRPGQTVVLTVRRNGEQLKFALTAESTCDATLGIYAPSRPQGKAPSAHPGVTPKPPGMGTTYSGRTPTPDGYAQGAATYASSINPRASFGFGLSCSDCSISAEQIKGVHVMSFDKPPEIAFIDANGPAYKAGLRRGDVLTHIDGVSFTSSEGARKFATAEPGKPVRFTVVRDGRSRTYTVRASDRTPTRVATPDLAKSSESLERAQRALHELQREQSRQMAQIQDEIRRSRNQEENRIREMQREFYRQEQEHRKKLNELSSELSRAETRMQAALADSNRSCALVTPAPRGSGSSRTLRYTGLVGDSEVEVRGPNPVTVNETSDEITITVGTTQVKVKNPRKR